MVMDAALRVLQVTDPHLFSQKDGQLLGMNTRETYQAVLAEIQRYHPQIDVVLATGDIAQDHIQPSYETFLRLTERLAPTYWLPGNHDDWPLMQRIAEDYDAKHKVIDIGAWRFVMVNSAVHKKVHGYIEDDEMRWLEHSVASALGRNVMVCLHHHPIATGCDWLDNIGVKNGELFLQRLEQFSQVKAVIWGHVHQEKTALHEHIALYSTPSTCIQFKPNSEDFALDQRRGPGWRFFTLHPNGDIETEVHRIDAARFNIDLSASGY